MNIFRIFFVSTVFIPVLVVVVTTTEESGIRIRKPRNIVISEDGTRTERRYNPVNISDKNCPALGCTGNLTWNENNGKRSIASLSALPASETDGTSSNLSAKKGRRSDSPSSPAYSENLNSEYNHPLKLKIKSIKNSTRSDLVDYIVANDNNEVGTGRGIITYAIIVSWAFFWTWRIILTFIIFYTVNHFWTHMKKTYGVGDDMIEYYVKLGRDEKHPFNNYGGGWNPTFGISLKSKIEEVKHGWAPEVEHGWAPPGWHGWEPQGWNGWASSYHDYHHQYPSPYHPGHDLGWPEPEPQNEKGKKKMDNLRHKFDREKGWKFAKKYTKKYAKKAHKYGLRPSKFSYMYDENGSIILGGEESGYAWRSLIEDLKNNKTEGNNNKTEGL